MRLKNVAAATPPAALTSLPPLSANIETDGNMSHGLGQPPVQRKVYVTTRESNRYAYVENLSFFASYGPDHYNDATCDVYVARNGKMELWRSDTVLDTVSTQEENLPGGQMNTGLSRQFRLTTGYRPGSTIYFRVAAVNGSSQLGNYSAWVPVTLPDPVPNGGTASITQTKVTLAGIDSGLAAPANMTAVLNGTDNGLIDLSWDAVGGASGYYTQVCYQDPALNPETDYLDLGAGKAIPAGALVVVRKKWLTMPTTLSNRVANSAGTQFCTLQFRENYNLASEAAGEVPVFTPYTGGDPAPSGVDADYFLRCPNNTDWFRWGFYGGTLQEFYKHLVIGRTYRARFLMRADANRTVNFEVQNATGGTATFNVTTDWQWFEQDFSIPSHEETGSSRALRLSGSAGTVDIADCYAYDTTVDFRDMMPSYKSRLVAGGYLRPHMAIKSGFHCDMDAMICRHGFGNRFYYTLHGMLWQCQANNMKPWLQLEWDRPSSEFVQMVDYLAAPSHPKRSGQGQVAPWVDEFDDMIFEFGNEAWQLNQRNFIFMPEGVTDIADGTPYTRAEAYGLICQLHIDEMKTSANWAAFRNKCKLYLGGFIGNAFGTEAVAYTPDCDMTGPSVYNGGWEQNSTAFSETSESFLRLSDNNVTETTRLATRASEAVAAGVEIGAYEWGPGYSFPDQLSDPDKIEEEVVMKSRIAGAITLDLYAIQALSGMTANAFFRVQDGYYWTSHSKDGYGAKTHLSYGMLQMIHEALGACTVSLLSTVQNPDRLLGDTGVPALRAYMFTSVADNGNRIIAAINRNIDPSLLDVGDALYNATSSGTEAMTINTGLSSATGLEFFANVGNFREHNAYNTGERINESLTGFDADSLCVDFDLSWTSGSVPAGLGSLVIDETYGAVAGGLPAGNCVLVKLSGAV